MFELCPYTGSYNEPSQWSVFGFLPPNWAWWARHLIVRPLRDSHHLNTPQWQLQSKILRNNLVKCHATPCLTLHKNFVGTDVCQSIRAGDIPPPTAGFSLHWEIVLHVFPKWPRPPSILSIITIPLWSFWNWTWERKWDANNERCYLPNFTKQLNLAQPGNTILPVKLFRSIEKWGQEVEGWSTSDPVSPPWLQPSGGSAWVANYTW